MKCSKSSFYHVINLCLFVDVSNGYQTHYFAVLMPSRDLSVLLFPKQCIHISGVMSGETLCVFMAVDSLCSMLFLCVLQVWDPLTKTLSPSPRPVRAVCGMDEGLFLQLGSKVLPLMPTSFLTTWRHMLMLACRTSCRYDNLMGILRFLVHF